MHSRPERAMVLPTALAGSRELKLVNTPPSTCTTMRPSLGRVVGRVASCRVVRVLYRSPRAAALRRILIAMATAAAMTTRPVTPATAMMTVDMVRVEEAVSLTEGALSLSAPRATGAALGLATASALVPDTSDPDEAASEAAEAAEDASPLVDIPETAYPSCPWARPQEGVMVGVALAVGVGVGVGVAGGV